MIVTGEEAECLTKNEHFSVEDWMEQNQGCALRTCPTETVNDLVNFPKIKNNLTYYPSD